MRRVYLSGRGLASALGPDLASGVAALRLGDVAPKRFELADGFAWPLHTIAELDDADGLNDELNRTARIRRVVQHVAGQSGALAGSRDASLFVATSSQDLGVREDGATLPPDYLTFADTVANWLDWQGPVFSVATACTSSLNALLSARALIGSGGADDALVLGLELRNRFTVGGFGAMNLLSATRAQPFGAARDGLVLGEAVAALALSSRPARWRLAGSANVVDGRDPAGAVPAAVVAMCRLALADAGLQPRDIALIKPQAAGSPANDAIEARALQQVFELLPTLLPLKAALGHSLGASGAAEIALLTACLESGVWPVTRDPVDPALGLAFAQRAPANLRWVLACILGFGGGHTAVVLEDGAA